MLSWPVRSFIEASNGGGPEYTWGGIVRCVSGGMELSAELMRLAARVWSVNRSRRGHRLMMVMLTPWLARAALLGPLALRPIISISRSPVSGVRQTDRSSGLAAHARHQHDVRGRACRYYTSGRCVEGCCGEPAVADHVTQRQSRPSSTICHIHYRQQACSVPILYSVSFTFLLTEYITFRCI